MWRWPSRTFWRVKSAFFAGFLLLFVVAAPVVLFSGGMRAFGPPGPVPSPERAVGWLVTTPVRPTETFPTDYMLLNFIVAIGVNGVVWSWVGSLMVAIAFHATVSLVRRNRRDADSPD